jgi:hypothetical protein
MGANLLMPMFGPQVNYSRMYGGDPGVGPTSIFNRMQTAYPGMGYGYYQ